MPAWTSSSLALRGVALAATLVLLVLLYHSTGPSSVPVAAPSALSLHQTPYQRPGTLDFRETLDGHDQLVPFWVPFNSTPSVNHGRLLEQLESHLRSGPNDSVPANLEYLRGRTILVYGDSNERKLIDDLCPFLGIDSSVRSQSDPSEGSGRWHSAPHVCEVKSLDLLFVHFMTYGILVPDNEFWAERKKDQCDPPFPIFDRIPLGQAFLAGLNRSPSLIVFSSNLWDLLYANEATWFATKTELAWSWTVPMLERWISRYVEALAVVRSTFPSVPFVTRNLHPLAPTKGRDFWNDARISDLNEAAEVVWELAGVEEHIDLARLLRGQLSEELLDDGIHMSFKGGLYLYAEIILDKLKRSVL